MPTTTKVSEAQAERVFAEFWSEVHNRAGVCGHCGKKKCHGKEDHSILPDSISFDVLRDSVREVSAKLAREG